MMNPVPTAPGGEEDQVLAEPAARRDEGGTGARAVPACTRVWKASVGDSTWHCPDPRPPAPDFGRSD